MKCAEQKMKTKSLENFLFNYKGKSSKHQLTFPYEYLEKIYEKMISKKVSIPERTSKETNFLLVRRNNSQKLYTLHTIILFYMSCIDVL